MFARIVVGCEDGTASAEALACAAQWSGRGVKVAISAASSEQLVALGGARPSDAVVLEDTPLEDRVARLVRTFEGDLLVLGAPTAARRAPRFGRLVAELVRRARVPVLVARAGPARGPVLAATDLTDASFPVINAAGTAAARFHRELRVVHALGGSGFVSDGPLVAKRSASRATRMSSARIWIHHALRNARRDGLASVFDGKPADVIDAQARAHGASLVVVGTALRSTLSRFVAPSVAERVLREAPCSVLVFPMSALKTTP